MPRYRPILPAAVVLLVALAFVPAAGAAPTTSAPNARPVLHAISPIAVPAGGALIAVGGSRLNQVHSVSFGRKTVHHLHHVSSTRLTVRAPEHALGQVAVTLHSATGASRAVALSYVRAPAPLHWHGDANIDPLRGVLTDLSCVTENFCVAIEHNPNTPTRLLRFGTHIAPKSTSIPESAGVEKVACGSNDFCVAGPATGAYIWNGSRWRGPTHLGGSHASGLVCARGTNTCAYYSSSKMLIHSASGWRTVALLPGAGFTQISCASATMCEAIAEAPSGKVRFERYDGSSWRIDHTAPTDGGFTEIACAPPSYCLAVSDLSGVTYELRGLAWTATASFFPDVGTGLSCGAPRHCANFISFLDTVGIQGTGAFSAGHWTYPRDARVAELSCFSATRCRGVNGIGQTSDLVDAAWSARRQLIRAAGGLDGLSCATRHWCMAIDQRGNALRWQDGHWTKPQQVGLADLATISCAPGPVCTVVDVTNHGAHDSTRAVRYVHGHWLRPVRIDTDGGSADVSCPTAGFCVAVDSAGRVITFDHGSWSAPKQLLQGPGVIDCDVVARCYLSAGRLLRTLHGHTWRKVAAPDGFVGLSDCVDPEFCIAYFVGGRSSNFAELHDGVWGRLSAHATYRAACASRTLCIAEAYHGPGRSGSRFEETFNGSAVRRSAYHASINLTCMPGPMCIGLTKYSARVGRP